MSVAGILRRAAEHNGARLSSLLREAKAKSATLILFGSRARGDFTPLSDYDVLCVCDDSQISGYGSTVNVFNIKLSKLKEQASKSPLVAAAILEGKVILDGMGIADQIESLREDLRLHGGYADAGLIVMPKKQLAARSKPPVSAWRKTSYRVYKSEK